MPKNIGCLCYVFLLLASLTGAALIVTTTTKAFVVLFVSILPRLFLLFYNITNCLKAYEPLLPLLPLLLPPLLLLTLILWPVLLPLPLL